MKIRVVSIAITLFITLLGLADNSETIYVKKDYKLHAPLDIPLVLSGNFGALRPNHFHSGVDFSTNGKTGLNVYSIDEGYVSRVYVSSSGYGRAIYVTHPSGITSVYGHIKGFSDKINEKVLEKHYEKESFYMNAFFSPDELPVEQGEVIAFSGNAGTSSGPHLHFEIRDTKSEDILDPLLFGFDVKDTKRPQISRIRIFPLNDESSVDGNAEPSSYPTVYYEGAFHLKEAPNISAWGNIGIGVEASDYLDASWAKCGISDLKVYVDGTLNYHHEIKRFAFSETRFINTFMDYGLYKNYGRKYMLTYKADPHNPLSIYKKVNNNGVIRFNEGGKKNIKIVAADVAGNTSVLEFSVKGKKQAKSIAKKQLPPNVFWNKENVIEQDNILVKFPAKSLYNNAAIAINTMPSATLLSKIYTVGDRSIPAHRNFSVSIKLQKTVSDPDKVYIASSYKGKASGAYSTQRSYNVYSTSSRSLGSNFALAVDTVAPKIQWLDVSKGKNLSSAKQIRFKISDVGSGVKTYRGEIDGNWVLFEQYRSSSYPTYYFDKTRLEKGRKHTIRFTATDLVGNKSVYESSFFW